MWLVPGSSHGLPPFRSIHRAGFMPSPASQHPSRETWGEEPAGSRLTTEYLGYLPNRLLLNQTTFHGTVVVLPCARFSRPAGPISHLAYVIFVFGFPGAAGARARMAGLESPACAMVSAVGGAMLTGAWADVVPFCRAWATFREGPWASLGRPMRPGWEGKT